MSYFCKTENAVNIFLNISKDLPIKPLRPRVSLGRVLTTYLTNIFVIMDYSVFCCLHLVNCIFQFVYFIWIVKFTSIKLFISLKLFFMSVGSVVMVLFHSWYWHCVFSVSLGRPYQYYWSFQRTTFSLWLLRAPPDTHIHTLVLFFLFLFFLWFSLAVFQFLKKEAYFTVFILFVFV